MRFSELSESGEWYASWVLKHSKLYVWILIAFALMQAFLSSGSMVRLMLDLLIFSFLKMTYNLDIVKWAEFLYEIQWILTNAYTGVTQNTSKSGTLPSPQKFSLFSLSVILPRIPSVRENQCSNVYHHILDLPELPIHGVSGSFCSGEVFEIYPYCWLDH